MSKAEELIACLEGEIAKRDEELAACRVAVENCEVFRARIAELEAKYLELASLSSRISVELPIAYAAPVSEAKAQGVVMPAELDRAFITGESCDGVYRVVIQSETLKEMQSVHRWLARLNAAPVQHPDDAAVDRFAVAMKVKLAASREKGRHGWQNATAPHLSSLIHEHMFKGDPLDVGNLAMMLHQNGQAIELPHDARRVTPPVHQVSVPDGPAKMQWPEIVALVNEVLGCEAHKYPCERGSIGHEMTGINFNSLARIIDRVHRLAAAPAGPADWRAGGAVAGGAWVDRRKRESVSPQLNIRDALSHRRHPVCRQGGGVMAIICRSIICLFRGHFYRPCYEHKYSQHEFSPRGRMTNQRFRYECACCHKPTKWMSASQHAVFLIKHNPAWGDK